MTNELDYLERIAVAIERIAFLLEKSDIISCKENKDDNIVKYVAHNIKEAWVVEPYTICLTSLPPKYVSRILHYKSSNEFNPNMLKKYGSERVFETEEEAITFCKVSLGTTYEIIDVPEQKSTVVINDDIK